MTYKYLFIAAALGFMCADATAAAVRRTYRNIYTDNNMITVEDPVVSDAGRFYAGARFDYTLANFTNTYSTATDSATEDDAFSFKPMLGFDATFGYQFSDKWRGELNYANTGKFEDKDSNTTFDISASIFTVNGIYTIKQWSETSLFVGAGLGAGYLTTKWSGAGVFAPNAETSKSSLGFVADAQIGLEQLISDAVRLVLYYKLGYMTGHTQEIRLLDDDMFIVDNGGILTNSFGIGLRLMF